MKLNETDILLVEDSQDDAELAIHALRREHLTNDIFVVRDGEEALDFLFCRGPFAARSFEHPPKLVLLDLKLPKVDGIEVFKQLKDDPRTKTIPIVILTSSKEDQDLVRTYDLGVNSYIQKPVDFEQFRQTVKTGRHVLDAHQPASCSSRNHEVSGTGIVMNATGTATSAELRGSKKVKRKLRVLLVEDNADDRDLILRELRRGEFEILSNVVQTADEFREHIRTDCPDLVLADYNLGQWRGTETLNILREEGCDVPLILVSGSLGDVTAVECIKQGVTDYVLKDSLARLPVAMRGALKEKELAEERKRAQIALAQKVEE